MLYGVSKSDRVVALITHPHRASSITKTKGCYEAESLLVVAVRELV